LVEDTKLLEDVKVNLKIKLSALWAAVMFLYVYADIFQFYVPGFIEEIIAGDAPIGSQASILGASILMVIPSVMVFLSLFLPAKANRMANIIVGLAQSGLMITTFLLPSEVFYYFLGTVEIMITLLIVWLAWNWPTQEGEEKDVTKEM
jgi:hypothetical protein